MPLSSLGRTGEPRKPKPYNSRHLEPSEHFQNSLPLSMLRLGTPLFFSEVVPEKASQSWSWNHHATCLHLFSLPKCYISQEFCAVRMKFSCFPGEIGHRYARSAIFPREFGMLHGVDGLEHCQSALFPWNFVAQPLDPPYRAIGYSYTYRTCVFSGIEGYRAIPPQISPIAAEGRGWQGVSQLKLPSGGIALHGGIAEIVSPIAV